MVLEERPRHVWVRREVQEREQHEPGAEMLELVVLGFLDLEDHPGARPDLAGLGDDLGAGGAVLLVRDRRVDARVVLDEHRHSVRGELVHAVGRDRDPVLTLLDLTRYADDQRGRPAGSHAPCIRFQASDRQVRSVASMMSNSSGPAISGGESCITGSPRSSVRQISPAS